MIAYGIYKECRNYNLSIPDDLSIVGVDDIPFSEILTPPLTTISQPIVQIANSSVSALLSMISHSNSKNNYICLQPILKVRASTTAFNHT